MLNVEFGFFLGRQGMRQVHRIDVALDSNAAVRAGDQSIVRKCVE